ncbi:MAG: DUF5611 family protein [Archaeoglobaceae archaeon]|nr:DUF5611 family protein [Archaeoglobaceae archaeon]MDW7990284.1 DUF5611 family protein [Archaeoglobaceae archaeon]
MREYKFKRGYHPSQERLEEMIRKHFGFYEKIEDFYVVRNFEAIEELKARIDGKILLIETKTRISDDESIIKTLKTYNRFLEELTGYTVKERQKMLRKEIESI